MTATLRSVFTLALILLATPLGAQPQPRDRVYRVGWLATGFRTQAGFEQLTRAFRSGLREMGYEEGRNLVIEYRFAEQRYERVPTLAAELVQVRVDVIFAPGDGPADGARQATTNVPIVFTGATDPIASRFVVSLAHPGGNMTGLTQSGPQVTGKRLNLLKELVPDLSMVAVLSNPGGLGHHTPVALDAARALGLRAQVFEAATVPDLARVFAEMTNKGVGGVILLPDSTFYQERQRLGELAIRHRLAMIGWRPDFAHAGALMAYGSPITADYRRGGVLAGKILSGIKPADLPVEEPADLKLVINLKTAKALGLKIASAFLREADEVIQ
jgi:ABC-type uncharacterized transport system substrate-binding protein